MTSERGEEQGRLAQVYSGMTAEELENVADDAASLTDVAREALQTEITKRGLAITVGQPTAVSMYSKSGNWFRFADFGDLPEALLAKGSLEASGIECFLMDDNMVGGVKLAVNREDTEAATAMLDQPTPDAFDVEGVGEYEQPRCSECQSLDVSFEPLNQSVAYTSASIGLPIPLHDRSWTCRACGHHWEDSDPIEPSASEQP
jgi:hypothetical protein